MRKTILVTGKNGQLGQSFQKMVSDYPQYDFTFVGRDALDFECSESISQFFKTACFDFIINCAAYTAVEKAESEPGLATQVNCHAVKQLAEIAKLQNSMLIHISTDYVFDGTNHQPYLEEDKTNPINVYGLTKLKGEQAIHAVNPRGVIIRTGWLYSEFGHNFVKKMIKLGQERDRLEVVYDQIGSPTYATDLAKAILNVMAIKARQTASNHDNQDSETVIYHYSGEGGCSWYDFAQTLLELRNIKCKVIPIETKDYPTLVKRPHYSVLDNSKIKRLGVAVPHWKHSLAHLIGRE